MESARTEPAAIENVLCVNIGYIPPFIDGPALNCVEVIDRSERTVRSANCDELLQGRLYVARFVGAAALQNCRLAVPHPGITEAHGADRLRCRVDMSRVPGLSAVDGNVDRLDPS